MRPVADISSIEVKGYIAAKVEAELLMRFAFSKTVAKSRGWVVLKPGVIVKPGNIDVLVGLSSDAPPTGRRIWFYTQPLSAPRFSLSILSYSDMRLRRNEGLATDNVSSTTKLIDRFEAEVDFIRCDGSYQAYLQYLDRLADDDAVSRLDHFCLTKAYLCAMAGQPERVRQLLTAYSNSPSGYDRQRLDASADRLREVLNRSLADAQELVSGIAMHNRRAVGLTASNPA